MQCQAKTDYADKSQCSRTGKVKINGMVFCIPHAAKICLQRAVKDGIVEPINPDNWFYKKVMGKIVETVQNITSQYSGQETPYQLYHCSECGTGYFEESDATGCCR